MPVTRMGWYALGVVAALIGVQGIVYTSGLPDVEWLIPLAAIVIIIVGRIVGLTWADLGLARGTMVTGLRYAAVIVVAVAIIAAAGVAIPWTRELFHNDSYANFWSSLYAAVIVIPVRTVLAEELIFRGALLGAFGRVTSPRIAILAQALLFGCWHVASSLGLSAHNRGIGALVGTGVLGTVAGVLLAVIVTTTAGLFLGWLRLRSGSILAPIALHWSVNGIGAIAAAVAWQLT